MAYAGVIDGGKVDQLCRRVNELKAINQPNLLEQSKIRDIMNGGPRAVRALLGPKANTDNAPYANLMLSAVDKLAQKLGRTPSIKKQPPTPSDSEAAAKRAEKIARVVECYDDTCKMRMLLPQIGRWLPGYGYVAMVVRHGYSRQGDPMPMVELRDPYGTYPGEWGPGQQPRDVAFCRVIQAKTLAEMYPAYREQLLGRARSTSGGVLLDNSAAGFGEQASWANQSGGGIEVYEYYDRDGCWWVVPQKNLLLSYVPNLMKRPQFYILKRFSFDRATGQYDQLLGLMGGIARMSLLLLIATEDSVMAEALALDTPLPTPTGWTTMGEVQVGDLLLGADGLPVEVVKTTDIEEDRVTYKVTFEDGTSVVASEGHLWETKIASSRMEPRVRTTQEMVDDGRRFRVPAAKAWKLAERDLPIDPYVLGLWLGDGHSKNAIVTSGDGDICEVEGYVRDAGYGTNRVAVQPDRAPQFYISAPESKKGRHGTGLHGALRMNDLLGNKHIPVEFLRSSIDQRTALLQGLMDSDGSVTPTGTCSFANADERVARGVVELLRSLGEVASLRWYADDRARSGGIYQVNFTPRSVEPFRLKRKAGRVQGHRRGPDWVSITSIERIETVPVRCIAVASSDHLFLAGEGAHVTHNTNVYGDTAQGDKYKFGRNQVNWLTPGTRVEKPNSQVPFQAFQFLNNFERQLRVGAAYPVTDDGNSPMSFVTGRGIDELSNSSDLLVREYFTVIQDGLMELDSARLEWDEAYYGEKTKHMAGTRAGTPFAETYTPAVHIKGDYMTRRVYGAMAGFDEPSKIGTGLQLLAAEIIDDDTMMENVDGLEDFSKIKERIRVKKNEALLDQMKAALVTQGDKRVMEIMIREMPDGDRKAMYEDVFLNQPPPPEQPAAPQMPAFETPEPMSTAMSRMTTSGQGESSTLFRSQTTQAA